MHEPILPNKDILICVYFDMYMYLKKDIRTMDDKCMYFKKLQLINCSDSTVKICKTKPLSNKIL